MRGKLGGLEAFLHGRTSANLGHLNRNNTHPSRDSSENPGYTRTISHKLHNEDFFLSIEEGGLRTRCAVLEAYRRARDASRQHHIRLLTPETKQICHVSHRARSIRSVLARAASRQGQHHMTGSGVGLAACRSSLSQHHWRTEGLVGTMSRIVDHNHSTATWLHQTTVNIVVFTDSRPSSEANRITSVSDCHTPRKFRQPVATHTNILNRLLWLLTLHRVLCRLDL